jgi:hypothetical protein
MSMYTLMTSIHVYSEGKPNDDRADDHFASRVGARGG